MADITGSRAAIGCAVGALSLWPAGIGGEFAGGPHKHEVTLVQAVIAAAGGQCGDVV